MEVITGGAGQRREARLVPVLLLFLLLLTIVAGVAFVGAPRNDSPAVVPDGSATPSPAATAGASPSASPVPSLFDASIAFPYPITEIVAGQTATWVSIAGEDAAGQPRTIYRIGRGSTESQLVVPEIGGKATSPISIAEVGGSLWAVENQSDQVIRFRLADGARQGTVGLGSFPIEPHVGFDALWSLNYDDGSLGRIDPATGNIVTTIAIPQFEGQGPRDVAAGEELLWAITPRQDVMVGIDPTTNSIAREVALGAGLHCGVAVLAGRIWVGGCASSDPLEVFDEATGTPQGTVEDVPSTGLPLFDAGAAVWIPTGDEVAPRSTKIVPVDPATLQLADRPPVDLGVMASWLVVDDGALWYAFGSSVYRLSLSAFPAS
jgi:hypothetical protein